mmetsp:Transcript_65455/g.189657  ORF Transcript_65455/g.189657 Transcript_65455/m.189657 type:complete len:631 (-) Transcript_65455:94-1986(-)
MWDAASLVNYGPRALFLAWLLGLLIGGHRVFRVPILLLIAAILAVEVICYFVLRWLVAGAEMLMTTRLLRRQRLEKSLQAAETFKAWSAVALELDRHEGREAWKAEPKCRDYHPAVLGAAVAKLRRAREAGNAVALMEHLRFSLSWNFGGYMNSKIYSQSHIGTKALVGEFVDEVEASLDWLSRSFSSDELTDRLHLAADCVHDGGAAFGSTCLFLSGGAALGFYHFGLLRAMLAEGNLPNLICGTSMGSICAAFIATRTDEEALRELRCLDDLYYHVGPEGGPMQGSVLERLWNVLRRGYAYEHDHMMRHLDWFTKELTFLEAFQLTGRTVTITCTPARSRVNGHMPTLLLNHSNAPNVLIASAVMASSCVPGLILPVRLQQKRDGKVQPWQHTAWEAEEGDNLQEVLMRDGSFESDVPISAMSSLFNTQFSIVSQVNPHIIPFFYYPTGVPGRPIRYPWRKYRGGFLVHLLEVSLKEDMTKNLLILQKTGLLFKVLGVDWSYIFTQQDHGEVTIVPNAIPYDYLHVMDNIQSREHLMRVTRHSERNAWRNFTQITYRTRVQRALVRFGEAVASASAAAPPDVREAVMRRCSPVLAEHFRVRGRPGDEAPRGAGRAHKGLSNGAARRED